MTKLIKDLPYTIDKNENIACFIDGLLFEVFLNDDLEPETYIQYDGFEFCSDETTWHTMRLQVGGVYPTLAQIHEALCDDWLGGERDDYIAEQEEESRYNDELRSPYWSGRI